MGNPNLVIHTTSVEPAVLVKLVERSLNEIDPLVKSTHFENQELATHGIKVRDFAYEHHPEIKTATRYVSPVVLNRYGRPMLKRTKRMPNRAHLMDFNAFPLPRKQRVEHSSSQPLSQPADMNAVASRLAAPGPRKDSESVCPSTEPASPCTPVAGTASPRVQSTQPNTPTGREPGYDAALGKAEALLRVEVAYDSRRAEQKLMEAQQEKDRARRELHAEAERRETDGLSPVKVRHTIQMTIPILLKEERWSPIRSMSPITYPRSPRAGQRSSSDVGNDVVVKQEEAEEELDELEDNEEVDELEEVESSPEAMDVDVVRPTARPPRVIEAPPAPHRATTEPLEETPVISSRQLGPRKTEILEVDETGNPKPTWCAQQVYAARRIAAYHGPLVIENLHAAIYAYEDQKRINKRRAEEKDAAQSVRAAKRQKTVHPAVQRLRGSTAALPLPSVSTTPAPRPKTPRPQRNVSAAWRVEGKYAPFFSKRA